MNDNPEWLAWLAYMAEHYPELYAAVVKAAAR